MDQPGPSSRVVSSEMIESPESPPSPDNGVQNVPRVGVEIPFGIGLEDSSEDEYEEPSSEEEEVNNNESDDDDNEQPAAVDYGYEEDFIGDSNFTLYSRQDVNMLRGWRTFLPDRRNCRGFLVPEPPIPERLNLVLRAISGINWQRAVLSGSGEVIIEQLSAAITGFSLTSPRERREFLRLFGIWANAEFRAGFRDLAGRGGFLDLD